MTSTQQTVQLAGGIAKNDPAALAPLIRLLYIFRESSGTPEGEILMDEVINSLYTGTDHCRESIKAFVSIAA